MAAIGTLVAAWFIDIVNFADLVALMATEVVYAHFTEEFPNFLFFTKVIID